MAIRPLRGLDASLAAALLLAATVLGPACSDSTVGGGQGLPGVDGIETSDDGPIGDDPSTDVGATDDQVKPDTPIEQLTVNTVLSDNGPAAGEAVYVFCEVDGLAEGQDPPATVWEVWQQPEGIAHAPEIDAETVVFKSVGSYEVRCLIAQTSWTDPTAAKAQVHAGEALEIETIVSEEHPAAGDVVDVTCEGEDAWGNPVEEDWTVLAGPGGPEPGIADGVVVSGMQVKALTIGSYEVACQQSSGGEVDHTPALIVVSHGLPKTLVTTLAAPTIPAGGATAVTCHAEDAYGNVVPDLPMAIDLPSSLWLAGFDVTGTVTGKYVVKCVPVALDWSAFTLESALLEILPGPPVALEVDLLPPKAFYSTFEQFTLLILAYDAYDNPIPNAEIEEVEVTPGEPDYKFIGDTTVLFKEEGNFTLTVRLAADPSIQDSVDVAIDGAPPTVTVTHPLRGATVQNSKPSVTVEGLANDTITGISSVTVNDIDATLYDDGTWSVILIPSWGLNVIHVVAEDADGNVSEVTQSFYFAELYYPMEPDSPYVPDAIKAWMDDKFIDDGVHNPTQPDDLATILEGVAASLDLNGLLGDKIELGSDYWLELKGVSMNPPQISLDPFDGGLDVSGQVKNFSISIKFVCEIKLLGIDICPDFSGSVSVGVMALAAKLYAAAQNAVLDIAMTDTDVSLQAIDVDIDGILGWLFDWLIDFLVGIFTGTIESMVEAQLGDMLGSTLADVINALAISQTLDLPAPMPGMDDISLTLESGIHSLTFSEDGGRLGLGASLLATKKVPQTIHGAIARGTCVKGYPTGWQLPGESSFEVALYDDLMNLALTTVWFNGVLNLTLGQDVFDSLLGGGEEGAPDLPIPIDSMQMTTTMLLPPIIDGCDPDGLLKLQLGDAFLDIDIDSVLFGGASKIGVYISMEMSAEVILGESDEGTTLGLVLYGIDAMHYEWVYVPELFEGSEEVLEEIIETELLGAALGDLTGEPIFEFPIPEIDLGDLSELFPPGSVIDPEIEDLLREGGHSLIQGHLE